MKTDENTIADENRQKALKLIEPYTDMQERIIQAIEDAGGMLTATEFDREFGDVLEEIQADGTTVRIYKAPEILILPLSGIFLGDLLTPNNWSKWVDLTQLMCIAGVLSVSRDPENGEITYSKGQS